MYANMKRIGILVVLMVMIFSGWSLAQTMVLNKFQLGKSTYDEVKANLPKGVKVTSDDGLPTKSYGGPTIMTEGVGYDINGLKVIQFDFDKKQTLVHVGMNLEDRRFDEIKKILSSKYQQVRSYPGVWLLFKANRDYVYLYLPRDKNIGFGVDYMTGAVYRQEQLDVRQTIEDKKALEREENREEQKALDRDAAKF